MNDCRFITTIIESSSVVTTEAVISVATDRRTLNQGGSEGRRDGLREGTYRTQLPGKQKQFGGN